MGIVELLAIGIGLAMDAFAVAICKGLAMKKMNWKSAVVVALYFGLFQAGMPVIGYFLGTTLSGLVESVDHWIAFGLLVIIGAKMIWDALSDEPDKRNDKVDMKTMLVLAIATSIDALAVGVTFAFLEVSIVWAVVIIGVVTFVLSLVGVKVGNKFGKKFQGKAELVGGIILIIIGVKILLEHLGVIGF